MKFNALVMTAICCSVDADSAMSSQICRESINLFKDHKFEQIASQPSVWSYSQHSGERSFELVATDGELMIERVSDEPWMLFYQTVSDPSLSGSTLRFSVDLRGDAPAQPPLHGFSHVAGLYLKVGNLRDAVLADHVPNNGSWDWQRVTVEKVIPDSVNHARVGFVHQSGGVLWARNPTLTVVDCPAREN